MDNADAGTRWDTGMEGKCAEDDDGGRGPTAPSEGAPQDPLREGAIETGAVDGPGAARGEEG